jgi:hypothetical protein
MIKPFTDFDGKMPYILVFGYSKAQMQKHHSIFIFVGRFFVFSRGVNFHFCEWTRTLLVTTKMELYIFGGRTLYIWIALVTYVYTDDKHGCTQ